MYPQNITIYTRYFIWAIFLEVIRCMHSYISYSWLTPGLRKGFTSTQLFHILNKPILHYCKHTLDNGRIYNHCDADTDPNGIRKIPYPHQGGSDKDITLTDTNTWFPKLYGCHWYSSSCRQIKKLQSIYTHIIIIHHQCVFVKHINMSYCMEHCSTYIN